MKWGLGNDAVEVREEANWNVEETKPLSIISPAMNADIYSCPSRAIYMLAKELRELHQPELAREARARWNEILVYCSVASVWRYNDVSLFELENENQILN